MACKTSCKLCDKLVISTAVAYTGAALNVTIPAGSYDNGEKVCIVIAQPIPVATAITVPVNILIGAGTVAYPLVTKGCVPVQACCIRTRTRYSTRVVTSATGGSFKLLSNPCCYVDNSRESIDGT